MAAETGTDHVNGTEGMDNNLIWYAVQCLDNARRLKTYIQQAERDGDWKAAQLFRRAQMDNRRNDELANRLLSERF